MNSKYNRNTMTDMPLNASLDTVKSTPRTVSRSTTAKPKIDVIGKKTTRTSTTAKKSGASASSKT